VFTQEGVAMLSAVLNSERAIKVNVAIMRAYGQLRRLADTHEDIAEKLAPTISPAIFSAAAGRGAPQWTHVGVLIG
jgi:hypothetical protein